MKLVSSALSILRQLLRFICSALLLRAQNLCAPTLIPKFVSVWIKPASPRENPWAIADLKATVESSPTAALARGHGIPTRGVGGWVHRRAWQGWGLSW